MTDSNIPVVNGVALDSLASVGEAMAYLGESYNDGDITVESDRVILVGRSGRGVEHWESLRDSPCITVGRPRSTEDGRIQVIVR